MDFRFRMRGRLESRWEIGYAGGPCERIHELLAETCPGPRPDSPAASRSPAPPRTPPRPLGRVAEDLGDLAKAWDPKDEAAAEEQRQAWCHPLNHEGGAALLTELPQLDLRGRGVARQVHAQGVGSFQNPVPRRDYPTYVGKGWYSGRGTVERACKTVVGMRRKG